MGPMYIIFAFALTGAYSLDSYSYPSPSQPLELGNSPHSSIADLPLSQGYNYPSPGSASSVPSGAFGNSAFGSSPLGSSSFGGSSLGSSSFGGSPLGSSSFGGSPLGGSSFGGSPLGSSAFGSSPLGSSSFGNSLGGSPSGGAQGYNYEPPAFPSNAAQSSLPRPGGDLSSSGNYPQQNFHHGQSVAPSLDYGVPSSSNSNSKNIPPNFPSEQVAKHVYVYVAPSEPAEAESKQVFVPAPAVNHKIIFIKAPVQSQVRNHVVPLPSKTEEKTLVYVLVKKPEEQQIDVQPLPAKPASKPEVYFIKYNTNKAADPAGFPSGPQPGFLPGPGQGLPSVEDARRAQDPSVSQSRPQGSPVYGPPH